MYLYTDVCIPIETYILKLVSFLSTVCSYACWKRYHHVMESKTEQISNTWAAVMIHSLESELFILFSCSFNFQAVCNLRWDCAFKNYLLLHVLLLSFRSLVPLKKTGTVGESVLWNASPSQGSCPMSSCPSVLHAHSDKPPWACVLILLDQLSCKNLLWAEIWQVRAEGGKAIWK